MADRRLTPLRKDLAAAHLHGLVDAPRFVEGERTCVGSGRLSLRALPSAAAVQENELLFGEIFTVYERKDGWAWGQAASDLYVGYVLEAGLCPPFIGKARVRALLAPVFCAPELKAPVCDMLGLNALVPITSRQGDYVRIGEARYLHYRHLERAPEKDFVAVAQRFLGAPYVWGGKTVLGVDCSGLVQAALTAVGTIAPRDTDMMEKALGAAVAVGQTRRRGDLIFWKGHMGVMLDQSLILHANAFHMEVTTEPLAEAVARIEQVAGPITSVRRI